MSLARTSLLLLATAVAPLAFAAEPVSMGDAVEIPVVKVLAPGQGYDDNDMIQLVVDGALPNICYQQDQSEFTVSRADKRIVVRQTARRHSTGACAAADDQLGADYRTPVPFSAEVNVGLLDEGTYTVEFLTANGVGRRTLTIARAPVATVDSLHYASVTNAQIDDIVMSDSSSMTISFSGLLNSSCIELDNNVPVELVDDVLIVLPQTRVRSVHCLPISRPFAKRIEVAVPANLGRYLLHIRSGNGRAVNRLFTVIDSANQ